MCGVQTWCAILRAVPSSRLVLKNKPFACQDTRTMWLQRFAVHGIATWRIDLLPLTAGTCDHMEQYSLMDLSLDPWPYAGGRQSSRRTLVVHVMTLTQRLPFVDVCNSHNWGIIRLYVLKFDVCVQAPQPPVKASSWAFHAFRWQDAVMHTMWA